MKALPKNQQPNSSDPHFWEVWTGSEERRIDWERDAAEWTSTAHIPKPGDIPVPGENGSGAEAAAEHEMPF
jgi:hypothetical protein